MRGKWQWCAIVAATVGVSTIAGCAQDIGDIDRTEPNKIRKADLEGSAWWMHQKVTENSPMMSDRGFEGLMMATDKVVFVAEENYLVAYRSYPSLPGADDTAKYDGNYDEIYGEDYKGEIRAMFPIDSHFDVQREYDTSTGEQSNVIVENTSDRPWYERDYIRVDWTQNAVTNFEWKYIYMGVDLELGFTGAEGDGNPENQPYFERNAEGKLVYFDAPSTYILNMTLYDLYYGPMGMMDYSDWTTAANLRVVTSFARDMGSDASGDTIRNDTYEPIEYSNYDMNRFGLFRTERPTNDPDYGILNAGRILLANRHHLFEDDYTVDSAGNRVVLPIEERVVKTTPYYIFDGVDEPLLAAMSEQVIDEWNVAFKRAVYLAQNPHNTVKQSAYTVTVSDDEGELISVVQSPSSVDLATEINYQKLKYALSDQTDVFVACHIPVRAEDPDVCVPDYLIKQGVSKVGYEPREGDFRKNFLWLVNQRLDNGLLGYCPTSVDPLKSQSLSAQAHVYTEPMGQMARAILDDIMFLNGDLSIEGLRDNDAGILRAEMNRKNLIDASAMPDEVRNARIDAPAARKARKEFKSNREQLLSKTRKFDYTKADTGLKKVYESGLASTDYDAALENQFKKRTGMSSADFAQKFNIGEDNLTFAATSVKGRALRREMEVSMAQQGFCFLDAASVGSDAVKQFLATKYQGRSDYENILREIRARMFRATALHEMGHGFGLRHNHSGSFDSMNYFDQFWNLRRDTPAFQPNAADVKTLEDMYSMWDYTDKQINGGMLINMYSSIMDYSSGYTTDNQGLGKYDHAAIVYSYSSGTAYVYDDTGRPVTDSSVCASRGGEIVSSLNPKTGSFSTKCQKKQRGLIEYFAKDAGTESVNPATSSDLGEMPYKVLTHKDSTGLSTLDDPISISQPYLEIVHYRDFFTKMGNYDFLKNRALIRIDDYLAKKEAGEAIVRVPYIFCTDDNRAQLTSCHVFDHGADYFEQVLDIVRMYKHDYNTTYFSRDRVSFFGWSGGRMRRYFPMLSDFFQGWYAGDHGDLLADVLGDDIDLNYQVGMSAHGASFNLLVQAMATPEYGLFCTRRNGNLYSLTTDGEAYSDISEFSIRGYCDSSKPYFYVPQGEGRRHSSRNDTSFGFDYQWTDLELSQDSVSLHAAISLFDNEADVIIGGSGDMGTYTFGLFDYYRAELTHAIDSLYSEDYQYVSPVLVSNGTYNYNGTEYRTGHLLYPSLAETPFHLGDNSFSYDPITGMTSKEFSRLTAQVPEFGHCTVDEDCVIPSTADSAYCGTLYNNQTDDRCFILYDEAAKDQYGNALCQATTQLVDVGGIYTCVTAGNYSVSEYDALAANVCSTAAPNGLCPSGKRCDNGTCVEAAYRVETTTSLNTKTYSLMFSMFFTGYIGMDSTFYDQINIYRIGSGETADPASGYQVVKFENPFTGEVFGANKYVCEPDASGDLPMWCYSDNKLVKRNGGAQLLEKANAISAELTASWDEFLAIAEDVTDADIDAKNDKYEAYMNGLYRWRKAQYDLEYVIRDINMVRSMYAMFATLW